MSDISKITGKPKVKRGFAAMSPERRREIARKGGASVPSEKRSFAKDRDLAASAGSKGGVASRGGGRKAMASRAAQD
jgi:general stress protein YciG